MSKIAALTLVAITVIHRTLEVGIPGDKSKGIKATPPKIQVIQPKTIFKAQDQTEYDELINGGAARAPQEGETVQVPIENVIEGGEDDVAAKQAAKDAAAKAKSEAAAKKAAAAKTTEAGAGSTKTSASTGTTTSGSKAAGANAGDGSDLV